MPTEYYLIVLVLITIIGGAIPLLFKHFKHEWMTLLLAFSGAFLLGITSIHLMPETFHELGDQAGIYIMLGFLLQLVIQRISHGVEHGHIHTHDHQTQGITAILPLFVGLSLHAFMEGIPLGFTYQDSQTMPAIFLGVAAHKIPEAITLTVLLLHRESKVNVWQYIIVFSIISPLSGILAMYYGQKFYFISHLLVYVIPIVIGAFLHISTTILYESGTKHHQLSKQKIFIVLLGIAMAMLTLLFHEHSHG